MNNKEFFNSIASEWDDKYGHHDANKVKKIIEMSNIKKGSSILDVATGTGVLISYLLETSPSKITAVDISDKMIEIAKKKYENSKVEFVVQDVMDFSRGSYDYVFVYSAYPHFKDKKALFKHLYSLINDGGKLIIAHSESRDKINEVHRHSNTVCNDILPEIHETYKVMSEYFNVENSIDNDEMYYISGIKK